MRYKICLTVFISSLLIAIPQNSFTCGGSEDPYDYYTSFFSNSAGTSKVYKPFYYTALLTFYDDWAQDSSGYENDRIVQEWEDYTKSSQAAVVQLVYKSGKEDIVRLKESVTESKPLPKFLSGNAAANSLIRNKNIEAVSYLAFAKKFEPVIINDVWTDNKTDSILLNNYIAEANAAFTKASDPFLKSKWAFQRCKLSFYNNRYNDCIRWYDDYFTDANTAAVNQLALSYKGGSQYRLGIKSGAAYSFSKAFPLSGNNKKDNFLGFLWATDFCNAANIPTYTAQCKNNPEKANMLALFALYGTSYKLETLRSVYELNPSSA
ncbi:MAG: hypothetical protein JWR72_1204, partial [Flavisolibacter sp.]|nr:hypothetical protein [Flavisolibacter sp.]